MVLLWAFESLVLLVVSLVRILTAARPDRLRPVELMGLPIGRRGLAGVFAVHFGGLSLLVLAWCALVAAEVGWRPEVVALGVPAALVVLRYGVETGATWFGPEGQRTRLTPAQAVTQPFPRLFLLLGVSLAAFVLVQLQVREAPVLILALLAAKTPLDVYVTRRSVTR